MRFALFFATKVLSGAFITLSLLSAAHAQISLTGSAYTQDFDTLATSGTMNTTVPAGWAFSESGSNANGQYAAGTGSDPAGDTYSFGTGTSVERAFGQLQSGTLIPMIGANFQNNTGGTVIELDISYFGEQWRLGALSRLDRLDFQYSLNATSLTTGTWIDANALDFTAPTTTGAAGALDGNAASNRTAISFNITSLNIANGAQFWIRWSDFNATGADDGLGIDNFSINAVVPEPSTWLMIGGGAVLLAGAQRLRRKAS